mgnify:FL=1|jgi:hypothetical protein
MAIKNKTFYGLSHMKFLKMGKCSFWNETLALGERWVIRVICYPDNPFNGASLYRRIQRMDERSVQ